VVKIDAIGEAGACGEETTYKRLGGILVDTGAIQPAMLESALMETAANGGICASSTRFRMRLSSIRVATDKLDCLVNLVGELMTVRPPPEPDGRFRQHAGTSFHCRGDRAPDCIAARHDP